MDELWQLVTERRRALQQLSYAELSAQQDDSAAAINIAGREGSIAVTVKHLDGGRLRVVVQGVLYGRFLAFIYSETLDGFYKNPDGSVTPVCEDEFE